MFKNLLIQSVVFTALLNAACSKSSDSTSEKRENRIEVARPITQLSDCNLGKSVQTLMDSNWYTEYASESLHFVWELIVNSQSMTIVNHCSYSNSSVRLSARATTSYVDHGNSFEWLNEDRDVAECDDGHFQGTCSINVKPLKITYKFVGSCLVLSNPDGSEMVFRSR